MAIARYAGGIVCVQIDVGVTPGGQDKATTLKYEKPAVPGYARGRCDPAIF
jgi:hypothetical protein